MVTREDLRAFVDLDSAGGGRSLKGWREHRGTRGKPWPAARRAAGIPGLRRPVLRVPREGNWEWPGPAVMLRRQIPGATLPHRGRLTARRDPPRLSRAPPRRSPPHLIGWTSTPCPVSLADRTTLRRSLVVGAARHRNAVGLSAYPPASCCHWLSGEARLPLPVFHWLF